MCTLLNKLFDFFIYISYVHLFVYFLIKYVCLSSVWKTSCNFTRWRVNSFASPLSGPRFRGHSKNLVECQGCDGNRQNLNFSLDLHSPAWNTYYKLMALIGSWSICTQLYLLALLLINNRIINNRNMNNHFFFLKWSHIYMFLN